MSHITGNCVSTVAVYATYVVVLKNARTFLYTWFYTMRSVTTTLLFFSTLVTYP